ncbi:protein kinase [Reticulomyxa filosa]|uniref:Protein kinase n=1 Tax=Reticulomyxa filosa TaxID=46433 RepID=X6NZD1_RETFI|nr:protein kinase [Reticulomyxa filosa]|eukprot:ETO30642.1 protein kinase [Reticulomyxa filosa]
MSEDIEKHILKKYELITRLGRGAYGIVWKAKNRKTGDIVALKKIFDAFHNATDAQRTFREVMFLKQLKHDNVIKLYQCYKANNDRDLYLTFEHMETDLHAVIRANILQDIHKKYILIKLLSPSNLLVNSECLVKVCDFGLARSLHESNNRGSTLVLTDYVATRWYRSPEILLGSNQYTFGVDMWSIGCILGELLGSKPMFPGTSTINQLDRIVEVIGYPTKKEIAAVRSSLASNILESVKKVKTKTLSDLYPRADPEALNLLFKFLQFDPANRLNATDALAHPYLAQFHNGALEPEAEHVISIQIDDNTKFTVEEYREELYRFIYNEDQKKRDSTKEKSNQIFEQKDNISSSYRVCPSPTVHKTTEDIMQNRTHQSHLTQQKILHRRYSQKKNGINLIKKDDCSDDSNNSHHLNQLSVTLNESSTTENQSLKKKSNKPLKKKFHKNIPTDSIGLKTSTQPKMYRHSRYSTQHKKNQYNQSIPNQKRKNSTGMVRSNSNYMLHKNKKNEDIIVETKGASTMKNSQSTASLSTKYKSKYSIFPTLKHVKT